MTFDDGYDRDDVVRLYFGHTGGEEARDFARRTLVVIRDDGDTIVGHEASVSGKERGSLYEDEDDPDPTNDVRVRNRALHVRKSAVVMKRQFGTVDAADVNVTQDKTDTWSAVDDGQRVIE